MDTNINKNQDSSAIQKFRIVASVRDAGAWFILEFVSFLIKYWKENHFGGGWGGNVTTLHGSLLILIAALHSLIIFFIIWILGVAVFHFMHSERKIKRIELVSLILAILFALGFLFIRGFQPYPWI